MLGLYIGISAIYWAPSFSPELLRQLKLIIFVVTILISAIVNYGKYNFNLNKSIYGFFGFVFLIVLYLPSIFKAKDDYLSEMFINVSSYYIFIWTIYLLARNGILELKVVLLISTLLLMVFTMIHISDVDFGLWNLAVPDSSVETRDFKSCGFNLSRTGWSNGLALFIPITLFLNLGILGWTMVFSLLYSQFICGGRTGLLTSLVVVFIYLMMNRKYTLILTVLLLLGIFYTLNEELIIESMRIDRLEGEVGKNNLDDFSADRIGGIEFGLMQWIDKPIFGNGLKNVTYSASGSSHEIHNFWIKTLAESGIFPAVFLIIFTSTLIYRSFKIRKTFIVGLPLLIGGLLMTFSEPNALFGSFQNYSAWWLVAAVVITHYQDDSIFS